MYHRGERNRSPFSKSDHTYPISISLSILYRLHIEQSYLIWFNSPTNNVMIYYWACKIGREWLENRHSNNDKDLYLVQGCSWSCDRRIPSPVDPNSFGFCFLHIEIMWLWYNSKANSSLSSSLPMYLVPFSFDKYTTLSTAFFSLLLRSL